ncbi:MAG: DUF4445 domain-containing protein [Alphaproteobacteria bacterium]|nr:DUF4445 domain-containing protein [Alphaproteobacteria bacterium]
MPSGRRGNFAIGTPVLDAARSLGVYVESVCGGRGICGRCQVSPAHGSFAKHNIEAKPENLSAFSATEERYASKRALPPGRRLSCSTQILGDMVIDVPTDAATNRQMVRKRAEVREIVRDTATRLFYIEVEEPSMDEPRGDLDRVLEALKREWHLTGLQVDYTLLPHIQKALRKGAFKVTVAVHQDADQATLIWAWPGFHETLYGVAIDIGSTTIACHLTDLMSGRTVASSGTANPQIRFGEDLMSRVSYVMMNEGGVEALTEAVRGAIGDLIERVTTEAGIEAEDLVEGVFVANPVMHHLFLGIDPTELGGAPFALAVSQALTLTARDLGLTGMNAGARIYVLPCIAGHVGADAAAVALAEGPAGNDEVTLVVDVGTNAEIILGTKENTFAASSPTGPAFEGAEISCGQRAAPGAIERVRIDPETLKARVKVIGSDLWSNEEGFAAETEAYGVTGLCGSGIIEVIAEMFLAGIITADGIVRTELAETSDRVIMDGRTASYRLWDGAIEMRITQGDVRAIQLAKAALYAGCRLLMDHMAIDKVDRIKLAGAFGNYIDPKYAMVLGLVPDCDLAKVSAVGNAAGTGARMALLNRGHRREVEQLVRRIRKIETALEPRFQEHFVHAMALPNKVEPFPELAKAVNLPAPVHGSNGEGGTPRRRRRRAR